MATKIAFEQLNKLDSLDKVLGLLQKGMTDIPDVCKWQEAHAPKQTKRKEGFKIGPSGTVGFSRGNMRWYFYGSQLAEFMAKNDEGLNVFEQLWAFFQEHEGKPEKVAIKDDQRNVTGYKTVVLTREKAK